MPEPAFPTSRPHGLGLGSVGGPRLGWALGAGFRSGLSTCLPGHEGASEAVLLARVTPLAPGYYYERMLD